MCVLRLLSNKYNLVLCLINDGLKKYVYSTIHNLKFKKIQIKTLLLENHHINPILNFSNIIING